jgi:hypothetical protein
LLTQKGEAVTKLMNNAANAFAAAHNARNKSLDAKMRKVADWWRSASLDERMAMHKAQRESFARAMAPCEHGVADWETCPDCLQTIRAQQAEMNNDAI